MATTTKTRRQTTKKTATPRRNSRVTVVNEEAVRARAYELFAARGFEHGHDVEDWITAEKELLRVKS